MTNRALSPLLTAHPRIGDWITIGADGLARVTSGKVEFGQGINTALAQLVAHELDLAVERVAMQPVDTASSPDEGVTSGSRSIEEANDGLRRAAAELRAALVARATARLGVEAERLEVRDGCVVAPDGRQVAYAELVDDELHAQEIAGTAPFRRLSAGSPVGASVRRVDLPSKVRGGAVFVQDIELPGMLHGRVLRPPSPAASLRAVDEEAARAMPGVRAVVRDGSFVGVVAEREEEAIRAVARLRRLSTWDEHASLPADARFLLGEKTRDVVIRDRQAPSRSEAGSRTVSAEYSRPYLAHASLGPSCAVATFDGHGYEVWSHSQGIYHLRQELAKSLRVDTSKVRVMHREGAGCYGANGADDAALDAALLARALPGTPVRVQWMREDEFAWEPFGTPMVVRLAARIDDDGAVVDWSHEVWGNGHRDRAGADAPSTVTNLLAARHLAEPLSPSVAPAPPSPSSGGGRNAAPIYAFPSQRVVNHYVPATPIRVSALRSLGGHANVFAIESFMDEIAFLIGTDPIAFRLRHLDDPRALAVIDTVAGRAGWSARPAHGSGRGLGIGFARYKNAGCYVAVIGDVEVGDDLQLIRAWAAVDAGLAVNPDGLMNQVEGGIVQAASWTLKEEVRFDRTRITSRGWYDYPILTFSEAPEVHVDVIQHLEEPSVGVGEAFAGPTAAAIGNAIFAATGARLRDMPFTRERLIRAMT